MLTTLTARTQITRVARKEINPALHRAGLPTLGACDTLAEYRATLTKAQKATLGTLTGTPASTGHVKAKIREASARKAALAMLAELAA